MKNRIVFKDGQRYAILKETTNKVYEQEVPDAGSWMNVLTILDILNIRDRDEELANQRMQDLTRQEDSTIDFRKPSPYYKPFRLADYEALIPEDFAKASKGTFLITKETFVNNELNPVEIGWALKKILNQDNAQGDVHVQEVNEGWRVQWFCTDGGKTDD